MYKTFFSGPCIPSSFSPRFLIWGYFATPIIFLFGLVPPSPLRHWVADPHCRKLSFPHPKNDAPSPLFFSPLLFPFKLKKICFPPMSNRRLHSLKVNQDKRFLFRSSIYVLFPREPVTSFFAITFFFSLVFVCSRSLSAASRIRPSPFSGLSKEVRMTFLVRIVPLFPLRPASFFSRNFLSPNPLFFPCPSLLFQYFVRILAAKGLFSAKCLLLPLRRVPAFLLLSFSSFSPSWPPTLPPNSVPLLADQQVFAYPLEEILFCSLQKVIFFLLSLANTASLRKRRSAARILRLLPSFLNPAIIFLSHVDALNFFKLLLAIISFPFIE